MVPLLIGGESECKMYSLFSLFFFFFFNAIPAAHGSSQTRGQIGAAAAILCHSHSNTRFKPHLQPTPQLVAMPHP